MSLSRGLTAVIATGSILALGACQTAPPPPPPVLVPAGFTPIGTTAPYLLGDVIGGRKSRAAKMRAAKVRPLSQAEAYTYITEMDAELRRQTAGIGLDVLRVSNGIVVRIPAALTFDAGSATVKPQFGATLLEIARTVKTRNRTFVDVLAHTDTSGTDQANLALSNRRAAAVATYLGARGVGRARIASKGFGETSPLYNPERNESDMAANRRVEIRLVPYTG